MWDFFISSTFEDKDSTKHIARALTDKFPTTHCTSSWLAAQYTDTQLSDKQRRSVAAGNLQDIDRATGFIFIDNGRASHGKTFELGYAYAMGKTIIVYNLSGRPGLNPSVFFHTDSFIHVDSMYSLELVVKAYSLL